MMLSNKTIPKISGSRQSSSSAHGIISVVVRLINEMCSYS
jgi:hypothetical protein